MLRTLRHHGPLWSVLEFVADGSLCFIAVLLAATQMPAASLSSPGQGNAITHAVVSAAAIASLIALLYCSVGLYRGSSSRVTIQTTLGRGLVALCLGVGVACLALQAQGDHHFALLLLVYAVPMMIASVIAVRGLGYVARRASVGVKRVLIVGTGADAQDVAQRLRSDFAGRHAVVGFYPAGPECESARVSDNVFPKESSIDEVVREHAVDEVIVAVREQRGGGVPMNQLLSCRIRGIPVLDLTGFYERARGEVLVDSLRASWLVYGNGGFRQGGAGVAAKRAFDIVMSFILLVLALPLMLVTIVAVRLERAGPILYRQERVGLGGRPFMCLKFRSMVPDAEKDGVARWATKNDSRVTRVGAFIRKCRIDELPQLISVLKGDMSLVGPRPERPTFVAQLREQIPFYDIRHSIKPGVTGWAQVRYCYGASVQDARRKHQFDLYYVKNHTLLLDVMVLVETVSVVLFREGAQ